MQVFYHLDDSDDALNYALGAGKLFDVNDTSDYVQTILCKWCSYPTCFRMTVLYARQMLKLKAITNLKPVYLTN